MPVGVNGVVIEQIYGDNSSGAEFDTDGDGASTQEDEFVSVINTSNAPVDISGMEIWSDAIVYNGGDADNPDVNNGLYHTFPPGTVLAPGEVLYVVNEITGPVPYNMQEASEGGVESVVGDSVSTNILSEGSGSNVTESIALVDPASGDYTVVNLSENAASHVDATNFAAFSSFPGSNLVKEYNAAVESGQEDMAAGSSYQYDTGSDTFGYAAVLVTCLVRGTRVETKAGPKPVETLQPGDLVLTQDEGYQPVRMVLRRTVALKNSSQQKHGPVRVSPHAFGHNQPSREVFLSPQHRVMISDNQKHEYLAPAKALFAPWRSGPAEQDIKDVTYFQLVLDAHHIVFADGLAIESFYTGEFAMRRVHPRIRAALLSLFPELRTSGHMRPARPLLSVKDARRILRTTWNAA